MDKCNQNQTKIYKYNKTHLNVLQQVIHVGNCKSIEEGIRLMHLHSEIVIFCTDVLRQKVYRLGAAIADSNL